MDKSLKLNSPGCKGCRLGFLISLRLVDIAVCFFVLDKELAFSQESDNLVGVVLDSRMSLAALPA
jgi:hypothetical protein